MSNESIASEILRRKELLNERYQRWQPTFVLLEGAESIALRNFASVQVTQRRFADLYEKRKAPKSVAARTRILGAPKHLFIGTLFSGFGTALWYLDAVLRTKLGHAGSVYTGDPGHVVFSDFANLRNESAKVLRRVNSRLDQLAAAVRAEKKDIPEDLAANGLATMLFSPILYPPRGRHSMDAIAMRLEWNLWLDLLPAIADEVYSDELREKARQSTLLDLDGMFRRLQILKREGAEAIFVPAELRDLDDFREKLENRTYRSERMRNLDGSMIEIELPVKLPAAVRNWLESDASSTGKIVQQARFLIRWADVAG